MPYGILFIFTLASALLILLLPETHNQVLMDTIEDARHKRVIAEAIDEDDEKLRITNEDQYLFPHESSL